jgi:hypothetical protein
MKQSKVKELAAKGVAVSVDNKNPQPRQVIATAGKLRVQVNKGADRGKTNN